MISLMTGTTRAHPPQSLKRLSYLVGVLLFAMLMVSLAAPLRAQVPDALKEAFAFDQGSPTLIEADELTFFDQENRLELVGDVKINRDGFTLLGEKVLIDIARRRLRALDEVTFIDNLGNRVDAKNLDLNFDLTQGMIEAIKVRSVGNHQIDAAKASREGDKITFVDATYTTCAACKEDPSKPRQWVIAAEEVEEDLEKGTTTLTKVKLKLFGYSVLYLPYLKIVSPLVERKSGFLSPSFSSTKELGFVATGRYYFALAPNYDLTVEAGAAEKELAFTSVNWRHLSTRGEYHIKPILAYAPKPDEIDVLSENITVGLESAGNLRITEDWDVHWDVLTTNAPRLLRPLDFVDYNKREIEAKGEFTNIQERNLTTIGAYAYQPLDVDSKIDQQATLLPRAVHNQFLEAPLVGGELEWETEFTALARPDSQIKRLNANCDINNPDATNCLLVGAEGEKVRFSTTANWQKRHLLSQGQLVTTFAQGSFHAESAHINDKIAEAFDLRNSNDLVADVRALAGVEVRLPLVSESYTNQFLFEPIVQLVTATDVTKNSNSATNETSQSTVLEPTSLFEWNRFSSDERWESGTRANYGFEFSGHFQQGVNMHGFLGQSVHLGGRNAFEQEGSSLNANSGLENKFSDYVAGIEFEAGKQLSFDARAQFDQDGLDLNRFELGAHAEDSWGQSTLRFVHVEAKPEAGFQFDEQQVSWSGHYVPKENWRLSGKANYDIRSKELISRGLGLHYDDDCFGFSFIYDAVYLDGVDRKLTEVFSVGIELKPFDAFEFSSD